MLIARKLLRHSVGRLLSASRIGVISGQHSEIVLTGCARGFDKCDLQMLRGILGAL